MLHWEHSFVLWAVNVPKTEDMTPTQGLTYVPSGRRTCNLGSGGSFGAAALVTVWVFLTTMAMCSREVYLMCSLSIVLGLIWTERRIFKAPASWHVTSLLTPMHSSPVGPSAGCCLGVHHGTADLTCFGACLLLRRLLPPHIIYSSIDKSPHRPLHRIATRSVHCSEYQTLHHG